MKVDEERSEKPAGERDEVLKRNRKRFNKESNKKRTPSQQAQVWISEKDNQYGQVNMMVEIKMSEKALERIEMRKRPNGSRQTR